MRPLALALICSVLSACSGTASLTLDTDGSSPRDLALRPTLDAGDVRDFDADVARLDRAPTTQMRDLPTGRVRYTGQIGSNASINGQDGYGLVGDLGLTVDFDQPSDVDGDVTNINVLRGGVPVERLRGSLDVDGLQTGGTIIADAEGIVARSDGRGGLERSNLALDLDGDVVDDAFVGDAVTGSVTGFGDGFGVAGQSFDVVLDGGGSFTGVVD